MMGEDLAQGGNVENARLLITNVDWRKIFSINWESGPRQLFELIQASDYVEVCRCFGPSSPWRPNPASLGGINATLKRHNLPLKVVFADPDEPWQSQTLVLKVLCPNRPD